MTYERFSELWDEYMPKNMVMDCTEETKQAFIEYSQGDKSEIEAVRKFLNEVEQEGFDAMTHLLEVIPEKE